MKSNKALKYTILKRHFNREDTKEAELKAAERLDEDMLDEMLRLLRYEKQHEEERIPEPNEYEKAAMLRDQEYLEAWLECKD